MTYTYAPGPIGTLTGGVISTEGNSFNANGLSLGGQQSTGQQYFFGEDSVTITFAAPVTAVGAFFNVNPNSENYILNSSVGDVSTGSGTFDTDTFVFDGITSTTPFTSVTLTSDYIDGSFNIPEIEYVTATPLPTTLPLFAAGLGAIGLLCWRRNRQGSGALVTA